MAFNVISLPHSWKASRCKAATLFSISFFGSTSIPSVDNIDEC
jgi:hypothetical protein